MRHGFAIDTLKLAYKNAGNQPGEALSRRPNPAGGF